MHHLQHMTCLYMSTHSGQFGKNLLKRGVAMNMPSAKRTNVPFPPELWHCFKDWITLWRCQLAQSVCEVKHPHHPRRARDI